MRLIDTVRKVYFFFPLQHWLLVALVIFLVAILNRNVDLLLPTISAEQYTVEWFAAKVPYAGIRLILTLLLAVACLGLANMPGVKKFRWYFLVLVPLVFYLVRPGVVDYTDIALPALALALLALALGAAQEELFSRGIIQNYLQPRVGRFLAVLLSSIVFGLLHHSFKGEEAFMLEAIIANAMGPFFLGLIFATVYLFSKSLPLVIMLHYSWNIVQMLWFVGLEGNLATAGNH